MKGRMLHGETAVFDAIDFAKYLGGCYILTNMTSIKGMQIMGNVTLSSKFQISIPKEVRDSEGWKPGDKFAFVPRGKGYYSLVRVPSLDELVGIAKGIEIGEYRDRSDRY